MDVVGAVVVVSAAILHRHEADADNSAVVAVEVERVRRKTSLEFHSITPT